MTEELNPEILDSIQPFQGVVQPTDMLVNGYALQQTRTQYTTAVAVQKPRSISKIAHNVLEEAKLAGSSFYYRWEVFDREKNRKVPVEGESIGLAMCIARNYGNCVTDIELVTETPTHYLMKGVFVDLESGFTCPRLFRQRKSQKISGRMDIERQEDIVFQIGQSKAIRNAVAQAMPRWLIDRAIEVAKAAELSQIKGENIVMSRTKVLDFFAGYGVTAERIESERGKPVDDWSPEDIVSLRGMATALKEGRITADELFPVKEPKKADNGKDTEAPEPEKPSTSKKAAALQELNNLLKTRREQFPTVTQMALVNCRMSADTIEFTTLDQAKKFEAEFQTIKRSPTLTE